MVPTGTQSTKPAPLPEPNEADLKKAFNKKEKDVYIKVVDIKDTVYSDQTGRFPVRSVSGHKYIMVMVHIDSNAVLAEPIRNRTSGEMIRAYLALIARIKRAGFEVNKHVLDNECSDELKQLIRENSGLQLVPPGNHRANIAEVGIKAFKQHFLGVLAGTVPDLPWSYWIEILPQSLLQLNLL